MSFCWFTSFIGYPNFFRHEGRGAELAQSFIRLAEVSQAGTSYNAAKALFPEIDPHQVETKKAAFQEFGLLYVVPRSNVISLSPLGSQVLDLVRDAANNRRTLLLALALGLSRYQLDNPATATRYRKQAAKSDVLPYLACFYLLHKLGGRLALSELRGAVFGLQKMANLHDLEAAIRRRRRGGQPFDDLESLPTRPGTASNLKIYFMSHLGLDNELLTSTGTADLYGPEDQVYEMTQLGYEVTESVLTSGWPRWRDPRSAPPVAQEFADIDDYFMNGIGRVCDERIIVTDERRSIASRRRASRGVVDAETIDEIQELPHREYKDGLVRLIQHSRMEKTRNPILVRDAKSQFQRRHGRLFCEVCRFDFEAVYGERGKHFIEAHHRIPISEIEGEIVLTMDDLAMVCANCHRMLHRAPWLTVEQLRALLT